MKLEIVKLDTTAFRITFSELSFCTIKTSFSFYQVGNCTLVLPNYKRQLIEGFQLLALGILEQMLSLSKVIKYVGK